MRNVPEARASTARAIAPAPQHVAIAQTPVIKAYASQTKMPRLNAREARNALAATCASTVRAAQNAGTAAVAGLAPQERCA